MTMTPSRLDRPYPPPPRAPRLARRFDPVLSVARSWRSAPGHPWAVLAGAALLMALVGPFGTYLGMSLPTRLLHFAGTVTSVSLVIALIRRLAGRWLFGPVIPLWGEGIVAVMAAPPGGLVILGLLWLWAPQVLPHVSWLELTLQTLVVNLAILLAIHGLATASAVRAAADGPPQAAPGPLAIADPGPAHAFRQKLPLPLRRAEILALSAEDHYVQVLTDRGRALVLAPLSEAAEALGSDTGLRIHRSHWVARRALESPGTTLSRTAIRLADGTELPVSRSGRRALHHAGLG